MLFPYLWFSTANYVLGILGLIMPSKLKPHTTQECCVESFTFEVLFCCLLTIKASGLVGMRLIPPKSLILHLQYCPLNIITTWKTTLNKVEEIPIIISLNSKTINGCYSKSKSRYMNRFRYRKGSTLSNLLRGNFICVVSATALIVHYPQASKL